MIIRKDNYQKILEIEQKKNEQLVNQLNEMLKRYDGIFHIASVGNSIASGYSKSDEMIPLLSRITGKFDSQKIETFSYARVRKNEEYNIIKWIYENISHHQINQWLIQDILEKNGRYAKFNKEEQDEYARTQALSNLGFRDFLSLNNNIIIYNGLTGSFTDILRKGSKTDKKELIHSFRNDYYYLKMVLRMIYLENPETQVYICGIPDFLGLGITNIVNQYIKRAIAEFPNVVFVKGSSRNLFLRLANQKEFDIHYNKPEYLILLNNVFKKILENYPRLALKNNILNRIRTISDEIQKTKVNGIADSSEVAEAIRLAILQLGTDIESINSILDETIQYYDDKYLTDFSGTNREEVKKLILHSMR